MGSWQCFPRVICWILVTQVIIIALTTFGKQFAFWLHWEGLFLVADTQLYKRLCPSVGPSVRRSVRWSVRPSVHEHESKSGKTRIFAPAHLSATGGRVFGLVQIMFYRKLGVVLLLTSQWVFTRPTSIFFSLGIVRDIAPLVIWPDHAQSQIKK